MEESGEQCTVVFAYFVKELVSVGVGVMHPPPTHKHSLSGSRNNLCKDDSALFSRFLYAVNHKMVIHNVTFTNFIHILYAFITHQHSLITILTIQT
jgi:hypothetical protein